MVDIDKLKAKYMYSDGLLLTRVPTGRYGRVKAGSPAGSVNRQGVLMVYTEGKTQKAAHQVIWALHNNEWPRNSIRHIDGNLLNNKIENLEMESEPLRKSGKRPCLKRLKKMLSYDADTGVFRWRLSPRNRTKAGDRAGYHNGQGYLMVSVDGYKFRLHHLAWAFTHGQFPVNQIDHINRVRDDNRITNLREACQVINMHNTSKRSDNTTGVTGVYFRKDTQKYFAQINSHGKTYRLGNFERFEDAVKARKEAESIYHPTKPGHNLN